MYAENAVQDFDVANVVKGGIMLSLERRVENLYENNGQAIKSLDETGISDGEDVEVIHVMLAILFYDLLNCSGHCKEPQPRCGHSSRLQHRPLTNLSSACTLFHIKWLRFLDDLHDR